MGILGQGTAIVDGQRTTLPPMAAFSPASFGPQTTGVPNVSPIIPPMYGGSGAVGGIAAGAGGVAGNSVGGYGTADNNAAAAQAATNAPHSVKLSPVWWCVGFLLGGVLLLQVVSFRETVDESGKAGPLHESAREHAEV